MHCEPEVAKAGLTNPAPQSTQLLAPVDDWNVPARHVKQPLRPVTLPNVPLGQSVQDDDALVGANRPRPHSRHDDSEVDPVRRV